MKMNGKRGMNNNSKIKKEHGENILRASGRKGDVLNRKMCGTNTTERMARMPSADFFFQIFNYRYVYMKGEKQNFDKSCSDSVRNMKYSAAKWYSSCLLNAFLYGKNE